MSETFLHAAQAKARVGDEEIRNTSFRIPGRTRDVDEKAGNKKVLRDLLTKRHGTMNFSLKDRRRCELP